MRADFSHAVLAFGANLRDEHGFSLAHAKGHDALRAAEVVGIVDRDQLRDAFRSVYCASPDEARRFDRAFDVFFAGPEGAAQPDAPGRRSRPGPDHAADQPLERPPRTRDPHPGPDDGTGSATPGTLRDAADLPPAAAAWQALRATYSPGVAHAESPVIEADGLDALLAAAGALIARVRLGRSRRWRPARNGPRLDLRRTLRSSLGTGGDPVGLHRLGPPRRNPRFVVLVDGSRSMAEHAGPSLQFAHALCLRTRRARVFVFSTELREITRALRDPAQAGRELRDLGGAWGGGTRLGANLRTFVRTTGKALLRADTVVLIVSDGLDEGDTRPLESAMRALRQQTAGVLWLHPHAGSRRFRPAAGGMRVALPHIAQLLPARDRADLIRLARTAGRLV